MKEGGEAARQRGSKAYVVCIEISIPDIPKAVQHQIVRTRIDGDCLNEASHALNTSELGGGGHIKMQSWNAQNCPYIAPHLGLLPTMSHDHASACHVRPCSTRFVP